MGRPGPGRVAVSYAAAGPAATPRALSGPHDVSFYCDDIGRTVAELKARGVELTGPVEDHGCGLVTRSQVPGGFAVRPAQPKYARRPA